MIDVPIALLAIVAVLCLVLAVALSAGEAAVLRVTRAAVAEAIVEEHPEEGSEGAETSDARALRSRRLQALTEDPARTATSVAFLRLVAEMVAAACLTLMAASWFHDWWQALLSAVVFAVIVAVVVARVSPRALGRQYPIRVLSVLAGVLTPTVAATGWLTRVAYSRDDGGAPSDAELRNMVDRVNESEAIEEEEREMIRSVFELGETITREVMVPRTDMVTMSQGRTLDKALSLFLRSGFSRIPVTGTSVDDMVGVVYFKDVVSVLHTSPEASERLVGEVARPAIFFPESKPVDDLLREMQASASHIALVVDEYGGVAGLVTIEDALEEIVGELTDEHDRSGPEIEELGDGAFRVPARLSVDELGELFDLDLDDDDVDTVGGLLAKALGKVPLPGSAADALGLHLVADRVEGRRKQLATLVVRRASGRRSRSTGDGGPTQENAERPAGDTNEKEAHR